MLNRDAFKQRMTVLGQVFEKMPSAEALVIYYRALESRLTTEQFERACERVIMECRFFPVPAEIIAKATGDEGELIWAQIINAADNEKPAQLDERAAFALKSVGGISGLRSVPVKDRHWLKQDFLGYLKAADYMNVAHLPPAATLNSQALAPAPAQTALPQVAWHDDDDEPY